MGPKTVWKPFRCSGVWVSSIMHNTFHIKTQLSLARVSIDSVDCLGTVFLSLRHSWGLFCTKLRRIESRVHENATWGGCVGEEVDVVVQSMLFSNCIQTDEDECSSRNAGQATTVIITVGMVSAVKDAGNSKIPVEKISPQCLLSTLRTHDSCLRRWNRNVDALVDQRVM